MVACHISLISCNIINPQGLYAHPLLSSYLFCNITYHLDHSSQLLRHCWVVHMSTVSCSHTVLHLAVATSVYFSDIDWSQQSVGDGTDLHTQALPSAAAGPSYLLLAISFSHKQPWNLKPCNLSPPWPLQRGSVSRLFDVTVRDMPSHVWKLFCMYRTVKFLAYADVIEDAK